MRLWNVHAHDIRPREQLEQFRCARFNEYSENTTAKHIEIPTVVKSISTGDLFV